MYLLLIRIQSAVDHLSSVQRLVVEVAVAVDVAVAGRGDFDIVELDEDIADAAVGTIVGFRIVVGTAHIEGTDRHRCMPAVGWVQNIRCTEIGLAVVFCLTRGQSEVQPRMNLGLS